ncbi:hypothetical protein BU17DRAFT_78442 [Hysterangium stoloniferum]|nr:hypothetical protein BU17DRAFT_78442 [Hysterangium stoloniferum]
MDIIGSKWAAGHDYGVVLARTDLYLLQAELEINPVLQLVNILGMMSQTFIFNFVTGQSGLFDAQGADLPFPQQDEPATLPRVEEILLITKHSPWCLKVINPNGVTVENVLGAMFMEYDKPMSIDEVDKLPPRTQQQIQRSAAANRPSQSWERGQFNPDNPQLKRSDYLRTMVYFDRLQKEDTYTKQRLGFTAPNIFVMHMNS